MIKNSGLLSAQKPDHGNVSVSYIVTDKLIMPPFLFNVKGFWLGQSSHLVQGRLEDSYHFRNKDQATGGEEEKKHLKCNQAEVKFIYDERILKQWAKCECA